MALASTCRNPFAGEPKGLPNLLEGPLVPIHHPASLPKNLGFSGRERL